MKSMKQKRSERYLMLLTIVATILKRRKQKYLKKIRKTKRQLWSRKWLLQRNTGKDVSNLVLNEIRLEDPKSFQNFTRMSTSTFHKLLKKIEPYIEKEDTILRESITASTRLLLTLRFLATGDSFTDLSYSFRISVPAISRIIPETLQAICSTLKPEYLQLLQNLGKVDRTADEIFDEHLNNFNRQQNSANKLQKEFNNYIRCVRAVQLASKSLMDAICEVYEPTWSGYDALIAQASAAESLWQDFSHKLGDQVLIPLNTYTAQFPEMKKKIEKRNRKLIDYDSQRHSFQNLQANASKRKDDVKLTKGREQLEEARRTYEILNTELHDELPALYDSRILFLVTNLQTLFASEQVFHNETAKIYAELEAIVDKLATDSQRGSYTIKKPTGNAAKTSPATSPTKSINNTNIVNNSYSNQITNGSSNANSPMSTTSAPSSQQDQSPNLQMLSPSSPQQHHKQIDENINKIIDNEPSYQNTLAILSSASTIITTTTTTTTTPSITNTTNNTNNKIQKNDEDIKILEQKKLMNNANANENENENENENNSTLQTPSSSINNMDTTTTTTTSTTNVIQPPNKPEHINGNLIDKTTSDINKSCVVGNNNNKMEELYDIPAGATTTDLPPGVLYRVKATYGYVKEDIDELSFEVGDIIRVIEYDNPADQEDGWLMGQKEGTDEKGLFPANFTRPI